MPIAVTTLIDPAYAPAFGMLGLAAQMSAPLFRDRPAMLTAQLCGAASYAASYGLLGQQTATAVCLTGAIQTTVALLTGNRIWLPKVGYLFLPAVLGIGVITYTGLPTILAITACCLVMIGRMQRDTLNMRRIQMCAAPFGATHDAIIGAWPCLAGALVSFIIAITAYQRELHRRSATTANA